MSHSVQEQKMFSLESGVASILSVSERWYVLASSGEMLWPGGI